jgi:hypothetical protein
MPLQNRVDPCGAILALAARGTFMGNRGGALHNENREIVRQYASRRWITCVLEFKGRRRSVMSPGRYTELFFLDEAVALAAGHRPCAECRRQRYNAFRRAWMQSINWRHENPILADEMDVELHRSRIDGRRGKVTYQARLSSIPDGCFIGMEDSSYLVWGDSLLLRSPEGYLKKRERPNQLTVTILTPEPTVRCIRGGYAPEVHKTALEGLF